MSRAIGGYWLAMGFAVAIGILPLIPPRPNTEQSATTFSSSRALEHIAVLAAEPHPVASARNVRVREYIISELRDVGVEPELQTVPATDYYGDGDSASAVNVIARIPGISSTGAVAVVGHYDSVPNTPGANDDASAVAIMLDIARIMANEFDVRNDVILVFTDGEEPAPRFGSTAFVENHRWTRDIEFVINLETIGSSGPSLLAEAAGPDRWVINQYLSGAPNPTAFSFVTATTALIGGSNSDFASFRDSGIAGIELVYLHGSPIYHTDADRPGRVSLRSLHQQGANTLGITRHVAGLDLSLPRDDSPVTFFTIGRATVVDFPSRSNLVGAIATGLLLVGVTLAERERRRIARDAAVVFGIAVGVAAAATLVWIVLAGQRSTMGIIESYVYLAAAVALAIGARSALLRTFSQRWSAPTGASVVFVWWSLALVTVLSAPSLSYAFVLPALVGAIALVIRHHVTLAWFAAIASTAAAGAAVVVIVPVIDFFFQFAQPRPGNTDSEVLATFAIPLLCTLLLTELIHALRPTPATA